MRLPVTVVGPEVIVRRIVRPCIITGPPPITTIIIKAYGGAEGEISGRVLSAVSWAVC